MDGLLQTALYPEPVPARSPRNALIQASALAIYAAWVIVIGQHHEPWFDETQAWVLARDTPLGSLFSHALRYEGTPGLWHALLWLAARAGLPVAAMGWIAAACAIGGAAVIVQRAPFPLPLRIGLLASYFPGYQYSVVARSYCLDLLLVPLAAMLFARRVERPWRYALVIALLANTNAFSFLAAGLLGLELLVRLGLAQRAGQRGAGISYHALGALALAGAGGLFALWTAWQPADNGYLANTGPSVPVVSGVVFIANALFDRVTPWSDGAQTGADGVAGLVLSLVLLGLIVRLVLAGRDRVLSVALIGALVVFADRVHSAAWHSGVLFMVIVLVVWTQWHNRVDLRTRQVLLAALALLIAAQGWQMVRSALADMNGAYAAGRPAAAALTAWRAQHPGARIAAYGAQSFELQPWLPGNPYANYHDGAPKPQFVRWVRDEAWHSMPTPRDWDSLLQSRPDAVVASRQWLPLAVQRDPAGQGCRAGYRVVEIFPAAKYWRGISVDNSLILYERGACATKPRL